jgi:hypothetical protein
MLAPMLDLLLAPALACGLDSTRAARASALCAGRRGVRYEEAENVLCLQGPIDVEGRMRAAVLARRYRRGLVVVARSDGGSVPGAIDIADYLARWRYSIVVDGICASSCGQFLFLGARTKLIRGEGVVGMHGGPFSEAQLAAMPAAVRPHIRSDNQRFKRFYAKRRIGIGITNDFPPKLRAELAKGRIVFWIPKEADYARFHVRGVTYCDARFRDPDNVPPAVPPPPAPERK